MKQSKPQRRIPWYEFDVPYEKPSHKRLVEEISTSFRTQLLETFYKQRG